MDGGCRQQSRYQEVAQIRREGLGWIARNTDNGRHVSNGSGASDEEGNAVQIVVVRLLNDVRCTFEQVMNRIWLIPFDSIADEPFRVDG